MLLAAVTAVFLAVTIWGGRTTWAAYVQAGAEAAMVGALADWFAVTALFRRPLGLPIPHTAIVVERKDQFAATLGGFIQESFLTSDAIIARLRKADLVPRLASWLRDPEHAQRVAAEVLDGAVDLTDLLHDDEVHQVLDQAIRQQLEALAVAPLAGRALEFGIRDGRHRQVLDAGLIEVDRYLDTHRDELRVKLSAKSPWWLPGAAEDRIFERLIEGARLLVTEMRTDPDNGLRQRFEERIAQLAEDLQHDPVYAAKGEQLKQEVLSHPQVDEWVGSLWEDGKARLRAEAAAPTSAFKDQIAAGVIALGTHLRDDPGLAAKLEGHLESAVSYLAERYQGEIVALVTDTIANWDAAETADRLELLLGPDLQYIRINGTVVGAMAGLALHAVVQLIG